jgi:excisionase family DNA binding protein
LVEFVMHTDVQHGPVLAAAPASLLATAWAAVPTLLTAGDVAALLRTSRKAVYALIERRQLPGVVRIGRRVLIREDNLVEWLRQKSAPSLKE